MAFDLTGIGALSSNVPDVGKSILDYFSSKAQADTQYGYNRDLAKYQNELNMQSWMQQQSYNSPANQMARFKAAGLNPNLVYSQGNSGNASSPVELSAGAARQAPAWRLHSAPDLAEAANRWLETRSKLKGLEIQEEQLQGLRTDNVMKDDESLRSAMLTYGDPRNSSRYSGGYYDRVKDSPYFKSLQIKEADLAKRILANRLDQQFLESERGLNLKRNQQKFELERYTNDPLFYYGNKALEKFIQLFPATKVPRFNQGLKRSGMIDQLRGSGYSVRKIVR